MVGAIVSLGKEFKSNGKKDIRETWAPKVIEAIGYENSRLATGYATLLYFTDKVYEYYEVIAKTLFHCITAVKEGHPRSRSPCPNGPSLGAFERYVE